MVRREELATKAQPLAKAGGSKNLTLNSAKEGRLTNTGRPAGTVALSPEQSLKEQRRWKARSFYGRHLPVLQCNNCSLSRTCPKFRAGYECAFLPYLNSHRVETVDDLKKYMKQFVGNSMRRAQLMNIIEAANGGMPSVETSEALDMAFRQLKELHGVLSDGTEETIEIEGSESLVGSIFGGMKLKLLVEETAKMHSVDPVVDLPQVPQTEKSSAIPDDANIAQELLKDAILGQGAGSDSKKGLRSLPEVSIEVSEIQKRP